MFRMINPVQDYAWGSTTAFSELFGWAESAGPQAEIWMGAHPKAPSQIIGAAGGPILLDAHLREHPHQLGSWRQSGPALPFLLKVLAVAKPLSIQVHPTRQQAQSGFAAEEALGIDPRARQRNYIDANHKPELLVALTSFSALCGFRDPRSALDDLAVLESIIADRGTPADRDALPALQRLSQHLRRGDTHAALRSALQESAEELGAAAEVLAQNDLRAQPATLSEQSLDTVERITESFPADPGLFVALMLNRRELEPGQALFLPSGKLHAYLGGVGVEVMANSDNVLRGGLTAKHVDVAELLSVAEREVAEQPLLEPEVPEPNHYVYSTPAEEFDLRRIEFPSSGLWHEMHEPDPAIAVCTAGELTAGELPLAAGESVFIPAAERTQFTGADAQLFIASAPAHQGAAA